MAQLTGAITVQCGDVEEYNNWVSQLTEAVQNTNITGVAEYLEHLNDLQIEVTLNLSHELPVVGA